MKKNSAEKNSKKITSTLLASFLRNEINSGRYRPGEKLESVRQLAARLGVGRQIALFALGQLVKHGLLVSSARRGYFVSPEFRPNRFYRIGLLVNDINPLRSKLHNALYFAALYYGYQLILFNNFENSSSIDELLKNTRDLDGVIITGRQISNRILEPFAKSEMPYVVLGKYDISPRHPSEWFDSFGESLKKLSLFIKKYRFKNITVFVGPNKQSPERYASGIHQNLIAANNPDCSVQTVFARENGYHECREILSAAAKPDLLVFIGEHVLGYRKYMEEHPEIQRPAVAISGNWEIAVPSHLFDFLMPPPTPEEYRFLMEKLLKHLNCL